MSRTQKLLVEWTDKLVSLGCLVYLVVSYSGFIGFRYHEKIELTILIWLMILLGVLLLKSIGLGIYFKERSLILLSGFPMVVLILTGLAYYLIVPAVRMFS